MVRGIAFGIVPRQYYKVPQADFMLYIDYPVRNYKVGKNRSLRFQVLGDQRLTCNMRLIKKGKAKLPEFVVRLKNNKEVIHGKKAESGMMVYQLPGDQEVTISW